MPLNDPKKLGKDFNSLFSFVHVVTPNGVPDEESITGLLQNVSMWGISGMKDEDRYTLESHIAVLEWCTDIRVLAIAYINQQRPLGNHASQRNGTS